MVTTSMCFALAFIAMFIIGGLNGTVTALIPFDWQLNDSYWIVAHIHYVIVGANLFPVLAGFYYWLPKMTGRMMNERVGMISFWLTLVGFNATSFPMHILGLLGMPRRIYTYSGGMGWDDWNLAMTVGAFLLAARPRGALLLTILLGCGFLVLNALAYDSQTRLSAPTENSYTAIFYVIGGVHAAHLILGLLFLLYAVVLPWLGPSDKPPHRAYRNAAMYWYFVTVERFVMYAVMEARRLYPVARNAGRAAEAGTGARARA